ncbi:arylsulfatase precursor [Meredithblackwellia eburnea MCA 4105]
MLKLLTLFVGTLAVHSTLALRTVSQHANSETKTQKRKNIVLILTDDQSIDTFDQRRFLPRINKHLVDEGLFIENFFAPVSVCCPSRVSLLRTHLAHSHNITFVNSPWGGYNVFNEYGYINHHLPDFLQQADYNTFYVGKYMNEHSVKNCESKPVSGWTGSDFLVDPHTYDYWEPAISHDNGPAIIYNNTYSTDLIRDLALKRLEQALTANEEGEDRSEPFFLGIAPIAPHSWISATPDFPDEDTGIPDVKSIRMDIPPAHPRHARLFTDVQAPRVPSWNKQGGVSWVKNLPELNATNEAYLDEFYRGRLRALQAVDELVEKVVERLREAGKLDDTYIFYTADNGYSFGRHRRQPGKTLAFEEDIRVPFIVRGPGVPKGTVNTISSHSMVDLSATILDIAGADTDYVHDGLPIPITEDSRSEVIHKPSRHAIQEYWVLGVQEGFYSGGQFVNTTYRNVRVHDQTAKGNFSHSYSVWCTGERELYDLVKDPYQLNNLLADLNSVGPFAPFDTRFNTKSKAVLSPALRRLVNRLDGLMLVLKTCKGATCTNPYKALFPDFDAVGEISTFDEALDARFDSYFDQLPRVHFSTCALGFQSRFEQPEWNPTLAYGYQGSQFITQGF